MTETRQGATSPTLPDPTRLMQLSTAYWGSQVLLTANRIGLFAALSDSSLEADEIARRLGTLPRPTRLLLNSCVALGLVEVQTETGSGSASYTNSPEAKAFLLPASPAFLGNAIRYSDNMYQPWGQLEQCLREGRPTMPPADYLGRDQGRTRDFVYAMHDRALGIGRALAELLDLRGRCRLLDVGGGPGTYSALLTRKYPGLRSRVMDLPPIVAVARDILRDMGASAVVETVAGDYSSTEFPAGNDVVLISGVFHRESEAGCRRLVRKAVAALEPGGLLVIGDVFTDTGGTGPTFATLFGLNMLLSARDGGVHADKDVARWLEEADLQQVSTQHFPPPMPHRLVSAIKSPRTE